MSASTSYDRYPVRRFVVVLAKLCLLPALLYAASASAAFTYRTELLATPTDTTVAMVAASNLWLPVEISDGTGSNFGFTDDAYWLRISVEPNTSESAILVINYPLLDDIILFREQNGEITQVAHAGDMQPLVERTIADRLPVFPLGDLRLESATYYLRFRTGGSMQIPIDIVSTEQYMAQTLRQNVVFGAYYGFMILLTIAALIAVVQFREAVFAYYFCYIVALLIGMFSLNGYAYLLWWPSGGSWPSIAPPFFIGLASFFGTLFASDFLQAKQLHRSVGRSIQILIALSVVTLIVSVAGWYPLCVKLAVCTGMWLVPTILYTTICAYRQNIPGSRYFLAAWGIFLSAILATGFLLWGVIPVNVFTANIMQISSMVDVVILSMALVERGRTLRQQKERAVDRANNYLASLNENLEVQVKERTKELTKKNEQLKSQAIRDSLTGLLNHKAVLERLKEELSATARFNYSAAVIMMDIDYFKSINDEHGHQTGDKVLQEIALTLRAHLRQYDVCGRYGGDEFIIVLSRATREVAIQFAERLRADISALSIPDIPDFRVTASFGIAVQTGPVVSASAERLVANADRALYDAKHAGRDIVRYFPPGTQAPFIVK